MFKFIAAWKLRTALENIQAPVSDINVRSLVYQVAIKNIKNGTMTPEEAAYEVRSAAIEVKGHNALKDLEDWGVDVSYLKTDKDKE